MKRLSFPSLLSREQLGLGVGGWVLGWVARWWVVGDILLPLPALAFPRPTSPHTQVRVFVFMLHGQQRPLPASHVNRERSCTTTWEEANVEAEAPLQANGC